MDCVLCNAPGIGNGCIVSTIRSNAKKEPFGAPFLRERGDSKGRPERSEGAKQSGGLFCRPWESLSDLRRIPKGCGSNWNLYKAQKRWNAALLQKVQKEYSHQKGALWGSFFAREMGLERPARAQRGCKTVRWTVLQAVGESLRFETHPGGMWINPEYVRCRKGLVRRTFTKYPIRIPKI